jgi:hypothetical protein
MAPGFTPGISIGMLLAACVERAFGLDHDQVAQQIFYQKNLPRFTDRLFS